MELIIFIIIIAVAISKAGDKKLKEHNSPSSYDRAGDNPWQGVKNSSNEELVRNVTQTVRTAGKAVSKTLEGDEPWKQAARENIEKAKKRAEALKAEIELEMSDSMNVAHGGSSYKASNTNRQMSIDDYVKENGVKSPETEDMSAMERIRARRMEEKYTSILDRARGNVTEGRADETLNTMEAEHGHSERVAAAEHEHPDFFLGTTEDLMVKGFDGSLCFERDFVGEGNDMISKFIYG